MLVFAVCKKVNPYGLKLKLAASYSIDLIALPALSCNRGEVRGVQQVYKYNSDKFTKRINVKSG